MLYLLFGADEFECSEALNKLQAKMWSDPSLGELNRSVLDGRRLTLSELRHHGDALPFLAERRLVIVEGLVTRLDGKGRERPGGEEPASGPSDAPPEKTKGLLEDLLAYLPNLSPTTDLVLLDIGLEGRESRGRIAQWVQSHGGVVREFARKNADDLAGWIRARVKTAGGSIEPRGSRRTGPGRRRRHARSGPGDRETDALRRNWPADHRRRCHQAHAPLAPGQHLHHRGRCQRSPLGERDCGSAPAPRRGRTPAGDPGDDCSPIPPDHRRQGVGRGRAAQAELARKLGVTDYPARKALGQAGRYTPQQLLAIYDRLVATDLAIKTGQLDASLALEMFVAGADIIGRP